MLGVGIVNDIDIHELVDSRRSPRTCNSQHVEARVFWNSPTAEAATTRPTSGSRSCPRADLDVVDAESSESVKFADRARHRPRPARWGSSTGSRPSTGRYIGNDQSETPRRLILHDEAPKLGEHGRPRGDYRRRLRALPRALRAVAARARCSSTRRRSRPSAASSARRSERRPSSNRTWAPGQQLPDGGGAFTDAAAPTTELPPAARANLQRPRSVTSTRTATTSPSTRRSSTTTSRNSSSSRPSSRSPSPTSAGRSEAEAEPGERASIPLFGGFDNSARHYNVYGAELGVRAYPVEGLDVYAQLHADDVEQDDSGCSDVAARSSCDDTRTSAHKVNAGVQLRTSSASRRRSTSTTCRRKTWAEQVTTSQSSASSTSRSSSTRYTLLNARVGYRFLATRPRSAPRLQHPRRPAPRTSFRLSSSGRRVMGMFSYKF